MAGPAFTVYGDLTELACDEVVVPADPDSVRALRGDGARVTRPSDGVWLLDAGSGETHEAAW